MSKELEQQEYNEFIKASIDDGSYFKDARQWYIFRYVYPVCERTILFLITIFCGFVFYILSIAIIDSFPLQEETPIIIRPKDQSRYKPIIKNLDDSVQIKTIDEAIVKYLVSKYVEKREGYNFRETNIQDLNNQLKYIQNNSTAKEYKNLQNFLNRSNKNSPIKYFGRDYQRIVDIESVRFIRKEFGTFVEKARDFIDVQIPSEVIVRYRIITKINSKDVSRQRYLARIKFKFSGVDTNQSLGSKLDFLVSGYKIYKIK